MQSKFYIAERFYLSENRDYKIIDRHITDNEIVTMDNALCKRRLFDIGTKEYIGEVLNYKDISKYNITIDEQIIKYSHVSEDIVNVKNQDFEFCGYDILDSFGENSWVTNYGIQYDVSNNNYTKFGLLRSYKDALKWLNENQKLNDQLIASECKILAVWRRVLK